MTVRHRVTTRIAAARRGMIARSREIVRSGVIAPVDFVPVPPVPNGPHAVGRNVLPHVQVAPTGPKATTGTAMQIAVQALTVRSGKVRAGGRMVPPETVHGQMATETVAGPRAGAQAGRADDRAPVAASRADAPEPVVHPPVASRARRN